MLNFASMRQIRMYHVSVHTSPPPFTPPAPAQPKKSRTGLIIGITIIAVVGGCVLMVGLMAYMFTGFWGKMTPSIGCAIAFEGARDALLEYAAEHDGALPNAESWQDDIRELMRRRLKEEADVPFDLKIMDPDGDWGCFKDDGKSMTGMAFNSALSGKKLAEISDPATIYLVFEIESPRPNAHEEYKARDNATSPKFMGTPRGWIKVPVKGEGDFGALSENEGPFRNTRQQQDLGSE